MHKELITEIQLQRALQGGGPVLVDYMFLVPFIVDSIGEFEAKFPNTNLHQKLTWTYHNLVHFFNKKEYKHVKRCIRRVLLQCHSYREIKRNLDELGLHWMIRPDGNGSFQYCFIKKDGQ